MYVNEKKEIGGWWDRGRLIPEQVLQRGRTPDENAVERAIDEDERDGKEGGRKDVRQVGALGGRHLHGELDGEQAEEGGKFDHGIERNGRSVLERIADRVADDRGVVDGRAFLLHFDFHDFLS